MSPAVRLEWDEAKRLSNVAKHGLDFRDAAQLFAEPVLESEARTIAGERRWQMTGRIGRAIVTLIFTRRGEIIRVISLRRARHAERTRYQILYDRRAEGDG
jgi:uncharacterized DUF497 family protein